MSKSDFLAQASAELETAKANLDKAHKKLKLSQSTAAFTKAHKKYMSVSANYDAAIEQYWKVIKS